MDIGYIYSEAANEEMIMVLSECRRLFADETLVEAHVIHDFLSAGWSINFIDKSGNDIPLTDIYGISCSYDSLEQAEDKVHQIANCPISIDNLFRFTDR